MKNFFSFDFVNKHSRFELAPLKDVFFVVNALFYTIMDLFSIGLFSNIHAFQKLSISRTIAKALQLRAATICKNLPICLLSGALGVELISQKVVSCLCQDLIAACHSAKLDPSN